MVIVTVNQDIVVTKTFEVTTSTSMYYLYQRPGGGGGGGGLEHDMGFLAESGKVRPQYEAEGLKPGKFKFIEIPGEHETEPMVSTGLETVAMVGYLHYNRQNLHVGSADRYY